MPLPIPLMKFTEVKEKIVLDNLDYYNQNYICQIKKNGGYVQIKKFQGKVMIFSSAGLLKNNQYPEIVESIERLQADNFIIECEIALLDGNDSHNDFVEFLKRANRKIPRTDIKLCAYVFDILMLDGELLTNYPFEDRYHALTELNISGDYIKTLPVLQINEALTYTKQNGGEGIVLKLRKGYYQSSKRSQVDFKVKNYNEKDIKFTSYQENPKGIKLIDDNGLSVQCSGFQHHEVKEKLDKEGFVYCSVQYLFKGENDNLFQPSFVKLNENQKGKR